MEKDYFGIIYKATFSNGKCYIGQTTGNINSRKSSHINNRVRENVVFHNAIDKYGKDNLVWEIIDFGNSLEELNEKEIYWISFYNSYIHSENSNGYNMTLGGNSTLGWIPTNETKTKIGNSNKGRLAGNKNHQYGKTGELSTWWGRKHTEEEKLKIGKGNKGKTVSEETRKKLSASKIGKPLPPFTQEHKDKIAKSKLGHNVSEEERKKISERNRGENSPFAKLTEIQVKEIIQKLLNKQSNISLSTEYNVSEKIIGGIKCNRTWKHIMPEVRNRLIKTNKRKTKNEN